MQLTGAHSEEGFWSWIVTFRTVVLEGHLGSPARREGSLGPEDEWIEIAETVQSLRVRGPSTGIGSDSLTLHHLRSQEM